jgi:hypothetical protein
MVLVPSPLVLLDETLPRSQLVMVTAAEAVPPDNRRAAVTATDILVLNIVKFPNNS